MRTSSSSETLLLWLGLIRAVSNAFCKLQTCFRRQD